jgi:hypothetical protein
LWALGGPLLALCLCLDAPSGAEETVVLRTAGGMFLRVDEAGRLRADRPYPTENEALQLVQRDGNVVTLAVNDNRWLVPDASGQALQAVRLPDEPTGRQILELVHIEANRAAVRGSDASNFITFAAQAPIEVNPDPPNVPRDDQVVEIYRFSHIPMTLRSGLSVALGVLAMKELEDKVYDKVRSRLKVEYIELPAPTLRDLDRKKKHRLYAVREEYHVRAELAGTPTIEITHMPCLKGFFDPAQSAMMFVVEARVPVSAKVRYKIPNALSASTNLRTTAGISVVGQLRAEKPKDGITLSSPELLHVHALIHGLDISNDVLNTLRAPIEDLANREIRRNQGRIKSEANEAIQKAIQSQEFRHPLLRYLKLP